MKYQSVATQDPSQPLASCKADLTEMSYEFRTSLNTILMSVELLETQKASGRDVGSTHYLQQIRSAVDKMNALLEQRSERQSAASSCA